MKKFLLFAVLGFALPARAVDGVSLEAGAGNRSVTLARAGLQWDWKRKWLADRDWRLGGYWDASLGNWEGGSGSVRDLGFTPTFRYESAAGGSPYFEAGIGIHWISNVHVARSRNFSTNIQFGDHAGIGWRFGGQRRYDFSVRVQHVSNGGVQDPNPGINFVLLRLQLHFGD